MTAKSIFIRHLFAGGWSAAHGPQVELAPDNTGTVRLPFLVNAENIIYLLNGAIGKMPGTVRLNSSALQSSAIIRGVFDFWRMGTTGEAIQRRIVHVGSTIMADSADGTFSNIFTGLDPAANPSYATFDDLLIIASDSTNDVPRSWDGTTAQNLAGSPPNFSFSVSHHNRHWAGGVAADPSRLYYSVLLDPEDWTGSGSGSIDINPNDGDRLTGLASYKNNLWVFKGPFKGSIHRITGTAPTGGDAFARTQFIDGLGAVNHNTIKGFSDDIFFVWSDATVRSLKSTAAFGDFIEASLSRDINPWLRDHVNFLRLVRAQAAVDDTNGLIMVTLPIDASVENNAIIALDFRFDPGRWSYWSDIDATSLGRVFDTTALNRNIVMAGGSDGFVRKLGQSNRSIDGTGAITYRVRSPAISYPPAIRLDTISAASLGIRPFSTNNISFRWQRDGNAQQTQNIAQGAAAVLGSFILGTDQLDGAQLSDRFAELAEGGEFRQIQYEIQNAVVDDNVEIHSFGAVITPGTWATENV